MTAKNMAVAPLLPSGSIDFNKLHDAALANLDPVEAVANAAIKPKAKAAAPAPRARAETFTATSAPVAASKKED